MVRYTSYGERNASFVTNDTSDILEYSFQIFLSHNNTCAFRVENNVGVQLCICVCHNYSFVLLSTIGRFRPIGLHR